MFSAGIYTKKEQFRPVQSQANLFRSVKCYQGRMLCSLILNQPFRNLPARALKLFSSIHLLEFYHRSQLINIWGTEKAARRIFDHQTCPVCPQSLWFCQYQSIVICSPETGAFCPVPISRYNFSQPLLKLLIRPERPPIFRIVNQSCR